MFYFFSKVLKSTNPAILDKTTFNVCCCTLVKEKPAGCKTIPQRVILFTVHHHILFLSYNKMAMGYAWATKHTISSCKVTKKGKYHFYVNT